MMGCKICKEERKPKVPLLPKREPTEPARTFRSVYSLGDVVGQGAYAIVKVCFKRETQEKFAVKIVARKGMSKSTEDAFREEVRIMRLLDSPHIIKCYDFFEEENYFFLVEEFVEGGELFDRIAEKQVYNEKDARDLVKTLLHAVKYCHDKDVVHRDLKLENVLLAEHNTDTEIKLADFGFATFAAEPHALEQYCGTMGYIAPEILEHVKYGKPVDMWSIGVIAYCLLGGHAPFQAKDEKIEINKIKHCEYDFDQDHWWDVSDEAKDLIRHLLVLVPEERYTVEEALEHTWINKPAEELHGRLLRGSQDLMKKNSGKKVHHLKALADAVVSMNRMKRLVKNHTMHGENEKAEAPAPTFIAASC